jgi:hypothetical protein
MAKKKKPQKKRNPLVRTMVLHTKPGPMTDRRRKLLQKARKADEESKEMD